MDEHNKPASSEYDAQDYFDYLNNPRKWRDRPYAFKGIPWWKHDEDTFRSSLGFICFGAFLILLMIALICAVLLNQADRSTIAPSVFLGLIGIITLAGGIQRLLMVIRKQR